MKVLTEGHKYELENFEKGIRWPGVAVYRKETRVWNRRSGYNQ